MLKKLALCLFLAAGPLAAQADTLMAGQARTTALADCYANIYYTEVEGAYEVVTTVAPGPDDGGRPMRFVSRLRDGDSQEISLGAYGESTTLEILTVRRLGDQVSFAVSSRQVSWRSRVDALLR
jgi:hypothetical protein